MTANNLTLGSNLKTGPTKSRTMTMTAQLTKEVSCVFPPTDFWMRERDIDAHNGRLEKSAPNMLLKP